MVKKLTLKVWMVVGSIVMILGVAPSARADQEVVARVPFDFVAGGVRLPAGSYVVTEWFGQTLVSIESTDRRHFTFVLTNPMSFDERRRPQLVFERVGDDHFLAKVIGVAGEGRELPVVPARTERER